MTLGCDVRLAGQSGACVGERGTTELWFLFERGSSAPGLRSNSEEGGLDGGGAWAAF